jgi:hypothetical protein
MNELLSFEDWCGQEDIEEKYERFHDEYGDLACSLWEYKERHYQEYVEKFKYDAAYLKYVNCPESEIEEEKTNLNLCRSKYYKY